MPASKHCSRKYRRNAECHVPESSLCIYSCGDDIWLLPPEVNSGRTTYIRRRPHQCNLTPPVQQRRPIEVCVEIRPACRQATRHPTAPPRLGSVIPAAHLQRYAAGVVSRRPDKHDPTEPPHLHRPRSFIPFVSAGEGRSVARHSSAPNPSALQTRL